MALVEVKVPDIGDFKDVAVIEVLVKPGDTVKLEQSLITVESDKASMEIPSSHAGVVKELKVNLGDTVNEGSLLLTLEAAGEAATSAAPPPAPAAAPSPASAPAPVAVAAPAAAAGGLLEVRVPDIGDFKDVAVIEVLVKPGDAVKMEQSLITVESDKASMEIPSSQAGVLKELKVKLGDTINQGDLLAVLEGVGAATAATPSPSGAGEGRGEGGAAASSADPHPSQHPHPSLLPRAGEGANSRTIPPSRRWACRTPARLCANSRASWACRWARSRAAAPGAASRRKTCRPSPGPSWPVPRAPRRKARPRRVAASPAVAS